MKMKPISCKTITRGSNFYQTKLGYIFPNVKVTTIPIAQDRTVWDTSEMARANALIFLVMLTLKGL